MALFNVVLGDRLRIAEHLAGINEALLAGGRPAGSVNRLLQLRHGKRLCEQA